MPTAKDPTVLMNVVVPDEPDGYRGRRRLRSLFTRRGGRVAMPALLVAASILVILIAVGVDQLLPKQAAGTIPLGAPPAAVSDDGGPPGTPQASTRAPGASPGRTRAPDATVPSPGGSGRPRTSPSPQPSGTVQPSPSPSGTARYPAWRPDHGYAVGDGVSYAGHDYQCIQSHTSLAGWQPPYAPALWRVLD